MPSEIPRQPNVAIREGDTTANLCDHAACRQRLEHGCRKGLTDEFGTCVVLQKPFTLKELAEAIDEAA